VSEVRLTVYNALGQKVETLVNETQSPGTYTLHWDGTALPAGLYFYEMSAGNDRATRKMILLK
ncbi:MAG: T9SS type A sorting domain-containing protein, partial [Calditrichaeota bacterium]|nr:T9SS type A sorting domain-containing protein [Calditrichota bacterium]